MALAYSLHPCAFRFGCWHYEERPETIRAVVQCMTLAGVAGLQELRDEKDVPIQSRGVLSVERSVAIGRNSRSK